MSDLQHDRPIHRVNGHVEGLVRQRDSPHARAGADIQHADRRGGIGNTQVFSKNLRRLVTQREETLDKFGKELLALPLLVPRNGRPA
jgi:hypothetical protein